MPTKQSFILPILAQLLFSSASCSWWIRQPFIGISLLHVTVLVLTVPIVSGFHVTQRSQHGDDIFGYMNDVNYASYTSTGIQKKDPSRQPESQQSFVIDDKSTTHGIISPAEASVQLVPLSTKPLLFVSSGSPVLSQQECQHLSSYFLAKSRSDIADNCPLPNHPGPRILEKLQAILDELILRSDDTIVEPRFLFYEKPSSHYIDRNNVDYGPIDSSSSSSTKDVTTGSTTPNNDRNPIFPDGLHVDTNNGKYFRYCTVLVYLTSSHAATVFPLANIHNYKREMLDYQKSTDESDHYRHETLCHAAEYLIQNHIQHTRQKVEVEPPPSSSSSSSSSSTVETTTSEQIRHQDFIRDIQTKQSLIEHAISSSNCLRIVPQMGHVAIFFNINPETGYANPYSFHGSEVSHDEKQVLTFFYELLPNTENEAFNTPMEFGQQIQKRMFRMQQKHISEKV